MKRLFTILSLVFLTCTILTQLPVSAQGKNSKILLIDKMTGWDGNDYVRLTDLASENNIDLILATGYEAEPHILQGGYKGIIVFGGGGAAKENVLGVRTDDKTTSKELLADLREYSRKGGRFVYFSLPNISDFNDELKVFFRLSTEFTNPQGTEVAEIQGSKLTPLWAGLEIGSKACYPNGNKLALRSLFEGLDPGQISTKYSVHGQSGNGEYMFITSFSTGGGGIDFRNMGNILCDKNITGWDNEKAARKLLLWLVGENKYSR